MKEQIQAATEWLKNQDIKGCITGSTMIGVFEGADIDVFCYSKESFTELYYAMYHNDMFQIADKLEEWKSDQFRKKDKDFYKVGVQTIKFMYNTCLPVNIILKKGATDIFSVLSSFDMDIICKGWDIETKQFMDLSENLPDNKATWNKWNSRYYNPELWEVSRVLRQLKRCFKYHNRGYNTDLVVKKYIELINGIQEYQNIFNSDNFSEKLKIRKANTKIVKKICETWLETHEITDKQMETIDEKIKEI